MLVTLGVIVIALALAACLRAAICHGFDRPWQARPYERAGLLLAVLGWALVIGGLRCAP